MANSLSDFTLPRLDGTPQSLADYAGKLVLVVNTASQCGLTPQYEGLEQLYQRYGERGLVILGFPCNQFGAQEPGTAGEIEQFCQANYGVSFPMFEKIEVNGEGQHPLYSWLKTRFPRDIEWNFAKFLVDPDGTVLYRYAPTATPETLVPDIEQHLP